MYFVLLKSYHHQVTTADNMDTTRLSSKGQLVLPKAIREADAWTEGTEFIVERVPEGVLLRPVRSLPATRLEDVIGCAGYRGPARSAADMERAIVQGVKARRGRGRYSRSGPARCRRSRGAGGPGGSGLALRPGFHCQVLASGSRVCAELQLSAYGGGHTA